MKSKLISLFKWLNEVNETAYKIQCKQMFGKF